jgi:hypothetical protein
MVLAAAAGADTSTCTSTVPVRLRRLHRHVACDAQACACVYQGADQFYNDVFVIVSGTFLKNKSPLGGSAAVARVRVWHIRDSAACS